MTLFQTLKDSILQNCGSALSFMPIQTDRTQCSTLTPGYGRTEMKQKSRSVSLGFQLACTDACIASKGRPRCLIIVIDGLLARGTPFVSPPFCRGTRVRVEERVYKEARVGSLDCPCLVNDSTPLRRFSTVFPVGAPLKDSK